jgi:hypothetical protein
MIVAGIGWKEDLRISSKSMKPSISGIWQSNNMTWNGRPACCAALSAINAFMAASLLQGVP